MHADKDGNLAVVAIMFIEGKENKTLAQAWSHMPKKSGDKQALPSTSRQKDFFLPIVIIIVSTDH